MSPVDLNHRKVPKQLIDLYFEQLFGHRTTEDLTEDQVADPLAWIDQTYPSYNLWLSYARLEVEATPTAVESLAFELKPVLPTQAHEQRMKTATVEELRKYIEWAIPPAKAKVWMEHFEGRYINFFISPVHFWYFIHCGLEPPPRPHFTSSPDDFFRHPLFLISDRDYRASLVVPEYFFNPAATFDGFTDSRSTSYYIFPNLACKLFYGTSDQLLRFADYYLAFGSLWLVKGGRRGGKYPFVWPDPVLKRHWRWREVLQMFRGFKDAYMTGKPGWCDRAPDPSDDVYERIKAYLNNFAMMVKAWKGI